MVNGNIGCTTCHGVHGSDSNSSTFDNISTLRGQAFRQLSTSKGYLLRAGLRGGTPTAVNACTTCHVNKTSHNGASQNVQCSDCHGGHVDTADGSQPNVYLIKRFINISTVYGAVRNKKVFFQYTGSQMNFVDVNGTGVCQACHQVPTTGIASDGTPLPPGHGTGDCMACHQHSAGKGSFSGGCTTCHGYPPQDNTVGGPTGKALGYGLDESTTKHLKHAGGNTNYTIACTECHYSPINDPNASNHGSHKNGSFQDVFQAGSGSVARLFGANPTYNATSRKCNNVYCHSTGAPNGVLGFKSYSTPAWVSGSATCNLCHDASPTTNAHQAHITVGIGCQNCHNATTNNGTTIANKANHANGTKDIQFYSQTLTNINSAKGGLSLCSTVYCHSNGKGVYAPPTWTSVTGKCGICHGADRAPIISTGAHFAHMSSVYGPKLDKLPAATLTPTPSAPACATCHTTFPADHLNGSVQSPSNCAAACHPNGTGTATWTSGTRIPDCLLCHGGTTQSYIGGKFAPPRVNFPTTGHGQFPVTVGSTTKITCTGCHDSNAPHIGVPGGTTRLIGGDNNTICANCHNNPAIVATPTRQNMPTHFTNFSGASRTPIARSLCVTCHDTHGTSNAHMIKTEIAFINTTTWTVGFDGTNFVNTTTNRGLCQVCHTKTNHWRAGVQDTSGHPNSGCLGCHDHKAALGAFAPVGGSCNGCHGYPPVPRNVAVTFGRFNNYSTARFEDYSGGGGAHTVAQHVSPTAKASQAWTNCGMCHDNGNSHLMQTPVNTHVSNVTIKVDPKYRFSNASLITYTGAKLVNPPNNKTGSCFNVSCHIQQSPKWSTEK
jgi:predicted CxxxxCH...CXXCH cytochrome family protein